MSEKELRDVINAIPGFVWSTLSDGAVDFVNNRWQFTGLSPQDALGWNWVATVHPDDRSRAVAEWRAALKDGRSTQGEMRVRRADGEFRWWAFHNVPLHDDTGNIAKWYGTGIDITDQKRAEEKLRASEQRLLDARMELGRVTRVTTLGELTASIAHEVNQPLAAAVANAQACLRWLDHDTPDLTAVRRVYAYMGGGPVAINPFDLIVKRIVVKGFFLNHPDIEPKIHAALRETVSLVASGAIQVPIAATYPLSSLREAVLHAQRGGKVLLDLRGTT
jgi:PAS domain S-box-containing protein